MSSMAPRSAEEVSERPKRHYRERYEADTPLRQLFLDFMYIETWSDAQARMKRLLDAIQQGTFETMEPD